MTEVDLEDILAYGREKQVSPEETARAIRSWQSDVLKDGRSMKPDPIMGTEAPDYWEGAQAVDLDVTKALSGLGAAAQLQRAERAFPDPQERRQFLDVFESSSYDPDNMDAPPKWIEAAREINAVQEAPEFALPRHQFGRIGFGPATLGLYSLREKDDKGYEVVVRPQEDGKQKGSPILVDLPSREALIQEAKDKTQARIDKFESIDFDRIEPEMRREIQPGLEQGYNEALQTREFFEKGKLDEVLHAALTERLKGDDRFLKTIRNDLTEQFTKRPLVELARSSAQALAGAGAQFSGGLDPLQGEDADTLEVAAPGALRDRFTSADGTSKGDMISSGISSLLTAVVPGGLARGAVARGMAAGTGMAPASAAAQGTLFGTAFGANRAGEEQQATALEATDPAAAERIRRNSVFSSLAKAAIELGTERIFPDEIRMAQGRLPGMRQAVTMPGKEAVEEGVGADAQNVVNYVVGNPNQEKPLDAAEGGAYGAVPFMAFGGASRLMAGAGVQDTGGSSEAAPPGPEGPPLPGDPVLPAASGRASAIAAPAPVQQAGISLEELTALNAQDSAPVTAPDPIDETIASAVAAVTSPAVAEEIAEVGRMAKALNDPTLLLPEAGPALAAEPQPTMAPLAQEESAPAVDETPRLTIPESSSATPGQADFSVSMLDGAESREVPISEITLSEDVPNFKGDADPVSGEVAPLDGKFDRYAAGNILIWERNNGRKEVISGRHRLGLARRSGERTIPAQIVRERDGFTKRDAMTADAELNIRDEKGTAQDFANYFRNSGITEQEAVERGLVTKGRAGRAGWAIGKMAASPLFDLHANGRIGDQAAAAIAEAAPENEAVQRVGIQAISRGETIDFAVNLMRAARATVTQAQDDGMQFDLFGADDTALVQMEEQARKAEAEQKAIREQITAVSGAMKRPDVAKRLGVDVRNPKAVKARVDQLKAELERWENWPMHSDLVARTLPERAAVSEPVPQPAAEVTPDGQQDMLSGRDDEPFNLAAESPAERRAREEYELGQQNRARAAEAEESRRAAEAATPELPMQAEASSIDRLSNEIRAAGRDPSKIAPDVLDRMALARSGDKAAFQGLLTLPGGRVPHALVTVAVIQAKDAAAADALGIDKREFDRADEWSLPQGIPAAPESALSPEQVAATLSARGAPGAIVNDPALPWEGRLTGAGIIELNAARLATPRDVNRVFNHEVSHLAFRDPAAGPDFAAIQDAMPAEMKDNIRNLLKERYADEALDEELAVRIAERLSMRFADLPAWKRAIRRIKAWAKQRLGLTLTQQDAEAIAARIVARGVMMARTRDVREFSNGTVEGPDKFSIPGYHGTHVQGIRKFSTDYVNTGEGTQVEGWGLYFASNPAVSEGYQRMGSRRSGGGGTGSLYSVILDAEPNELLDWNAPYAEQPKAVRDLFPERAAEVEEQSRRIKTAEALSKDLEEARRVRDEWQRQRPANPPGSGPFAPNTPEQDVWEKRYLELSRAVEEIRSSPDYMDPKYGYPFSNDNGAALYEKLAFTQGGSKKASQYLLGKGIKGIQYREDADRNYVVFDGSLIRVTAENGQPVNIEDVPVTPELTGNDAFLDRYSLPDSPGMSQEMEQWFGNDRKVMLDAKQYEARNATRRALETPLLDGIVENHVPGERSLEETISAMTDAQRLMLHDRIVEQMSMLTGTPESAKEFADIQRAHIATVPELAGQRNVSTAALAFTNLVTASAALSGAHGLTGAFARIISTDNDQIRFDQQESFLFRSDLGRLLGSQAGIGGRIIALGKAITDQHRQAFRNLGFTDDMLAAFGGAAVDRAFTAQELESMFADANISALGPDTIAAMAKLQGYVDQAAARAKAEKAKKPRDKTASEETELETLRRLQREAKGTPRAKAIAAAIRAYENSGKPPTDISRRIDRENASVLAGFRERFREQGGAGLAKNFWQLMSSTPRPAPGPLQMFDAATQALLGDLLRQTVERLGLAGTTESIQPTAVDRIVANLSDDALRWEKIEQADAAVRADIARRDDPQERRMLLEAWEEATSSMSFAIGGPAMLRRALRDRVKALTPDWKALFDTGTPLSEAVAGLKSEAVEGLMADISSRVSSDAAAGKLAGLKSEIEALFDDMAATRYASWLVQREKIADRQRAAAAKRAFQEALRTRGLAVNRLNQLDEWLNGTALDPVNNPKNPVSALMDEQMKNPVPEAEFIARMGQLGVTADVAAPLAAAIEETRFMRSAPVQLLSSILDAADGPGPLRPNLPLGRPTADLPKGLIKEFMQAKPSDRNDPVWRRLQITNWLKNQGIDDALAARLSVSMDEAVAAVMGSVIHQEQERYIKRQGGLGNNPRMEDFRRKFTQNQDKIREAIKFGLLNPGSPWQAWFSSITGVQPLTPQQVANVAGWESIISGEKYFPVEKGVAAAKLRDFFDARFNEDPDGWQLLSASYTASALTSGTTASVQITGPAGKFVGTLTADMIAALRNPRSLADVTSAFMDSIKVYEAEIKTTWKFDSGGSFSMDVENGLLRMSPLKRDMEKQAAILKDPAASLGAKTLAISRFVRSAQDYTRQAYGAADNAAVQSFARYFQSRELRTMMRQSGITMQDVKEWTTAMGLTTENAQVQAAALGYTGAMERRYVQDYMQKAWMDALEANSATPEEHRAKIASLLADSEKEAEFQAFVGKERDSMRKLDFDTLLGAVQWAGEQGFRGTNRMMENGYRFSGASLNILLRSLIGFVGVPLNATRAMLWYTPLAELNWIYYRAYERRLKNGTLRTGEKTGKVEENPYARSLGNALQVQQRMKERRVGWAIMLTAAAIMASRDDDDEDEWVINGYGPDATKHPQEAAAWRRLRTPLSFEKKTKDGNYQVVPFTRGGLEWLKGPLSLLAGVNDAVLDSRLSKEESVSKWAMLGRAFQQLGMSSITTGMRNTGGFRDLIQRGTKKEDFGAKTGFMASPLMPWSGAERWIRTWVKPERLEKSFMNNIPVAPWMDSSKPAINLFGDPLIPVPEGDELVARQFSGAPPVYMREPSPQDKALYEWIERTGKLPTVYSRSELDKQTGRTMTDDEYRKYQEVAGAARKRDMLAGLAGTLKVPDTRDLPGMPSRRIYRTIQQSLNAADPASGDSMKRVQQIMTDIGKRANAEGLAAIGITPPAKKPAARKKAAAEF